MNLVILLWSKIHFYPWRWSQALKDVEAKMLENFVEYKKNKILVWCYYSIWSVKYSLHVGPPCYHIKTQNLLLIMSIFLMTWQYMHTILVTSMLSTCDLKWGQYRHTLFSSSEAPYVALCCVYAIPNLHNNFSLVL